eukprot:CAMPEP_0117734816 /NCGR_PEP_ID=MMETSP0947-20121206/910_1 /TAXON_ID=44440 /ORGANISM="Chattonella subsalsa, Strain CCMP2191" /LENGTH=257 /DNA_ID=CAMNT_0005549689 /DNA_START=24 /DNA_END=794 /DNA_ORIENTATION=+
MGTEANQWEACATTDKQKHRRSLANSRHPSRTYEALEHTRPGRLYTQRLSEKPWHMTLRQGGSGSGTPISTPMYCRSPYSEDNFRPESNPQTPPRNSPSRRKSPAAYSLNSPQSVGSVTSGTSREGRNRKREQGGRSPRELSEDLYYGRQLISRSKGKAASCSPRSAKQKSRTSVRSMKHPPVTETRLGLAKRVASMPEDTLRGYLHFDPKPIEPRRRPSLSSRGRTRPQSGSQSMRSREASGLSGFSAQSNDRPRW